MMAVTVLAYEEQKVVKVPSIENMSETQAVQKLNQIGLVANFRECFSDAINKSNVTPGSQRPEAGKDFLAGKEVRANVSMGPYPIVIGLSADEARYILEEANIAYEILDGHNSSVKEGYVFDQEPKEINCPGPDFKVKIFINKPLTIQIMSPKENQNVSSYIVVTGRVSSDLMKNESLWIAVKPLANINNWWPQDNPPKVEPISKEFQGEAFLGGEKGDRFEIGILVVDNETNKKFMDWLNTSKKENDWPSITGGRPGTDQKVAKEIIEARKLAKVVVTLSQ